MNTHAFEKKLHSLKARFGLQLFVLAAVVCTSWIVTDHANAVYILTGPEDVYKRQVQDIQNGHLEVVDDLLVTIQKLMK